MRHKEIQSRILEYVLELLHIEKKYFDWSQSVPGLMPIQLELPLTEAPPREKLLPPKRRHRSPRGLSSLARSLVLRPPFSNTYPVRSHLVAGDRRATACHDLFQMEKKSKNLTCRRVIQLPLVGIMGRVCLGGHGRVVLVVLLATLLKEDAWSYSNPARYMS